jgi:hypothetical protein
MTRPVRRPRAGRRVWPGKAGQPRPRIPATATERVVAVDDAGRKRRSEFWLRGRLVGRAWWDETDAIATGLRRGVPNGYQIEYVDGRVSYAEPFVGGVQHGWARQYARSGRLIIECRFDRGTGTDYWCDDRGHLSEEHPLVSGKPSGVERWWASERGIYSETHWLEGQWHGPRRHWREGKLDRGFPQFFIRGKRASKRDYLKAVRRDPTLPAYRPEDDSPERTLPRAFAALRARARKKNRRRPARR